MPLLLQAALDELEEHMQPFLEVSVSYMRAQVLFCHAIIKTAPNVQLTIVGYCCS
jgi:hypothetical protein